MSDQLLWPLPLSSSETLRFPTEEESVGGHPSSQHNFILNMHGPGCDSLIFKTPLLVTV